MHKSFTGTYVDQGNPSQQRQYDASYEAVRDRATWAAIVRSEGTTLRGETNLRHVEGNIEKAIAAAVGRAIEATLGVGAN